MTAENNEFDLGVDLPPDFNVVIAEKYCSSVRDGTHDSPKPVDSGKMLITSKHLKNGHVLLQDAYLISDEDFEQINKRSKVDQWDLLFSMIGTVGEMALVYEKDPGYAIKNIGLFKCGEAFKAKWLHLYFLTPYARAEIERRKKGSTQQYISSGDLRSFPIIESCKPSIRDSIVTILTPFDDRIELNRRTSTTLEEMAQATFQSWFVDFDPVYAKAEGRIPVGMDAATATLFPDSLADSELGDIPSGWQATTLAAIVAERTARVGSSNGHVVLSAVSSGELKRSDEHFDKQVHSQDTSKYKAVEQWDYAYNPSRINIGSIGMLEQPALGAVSPVYTVVRPAEGYAWFLRFFLDLPQTREIINQFCSGSVRQSLSFKDFASIPVVLPPVAVAQAFARYWMQLDATRKQLDAESRQLAEIRDALLPKLMTGELRVPETLMA